MKRFLLIRILIMSVLVVAAGFVRPQPTTPPSSPAFAVQILRTDGYHSGKQYPAVTVVRSLSELTAYYEANKELYQLERRTDPASDSTIGFLDAIDKYNDAYFENKLLILILVEESSGSNRHQVTGIVRSEAGLEILVDRQVPEFGTTDMAQWHILVELDTADLDPAAVNIRFTQRFARESPVVLVSKGVTYPLIEHWVYSVTNGLCADGKWFDRLALEMDPALNADLASAQVIPYDDDFSFMRVGPGGAERLEALSFNVFDENLTKIQNSVKQLDLPSQGGVYVVAVFVSRGDKNNGSGYQYVFKTQR